MMLTKPILHQKHKEYLLQNSPVDRIVEDRGICDWYGGKVFSEFVGSAGGDVTVYRVYGSEQKHFELCIK